MGFPLDGSYGPKDLDDHAQSEDQSQGGFHSLTPPTSTMISGEFHVCVYIMGARNTHSLRLR